MRVTDVIACVLVLSSVLDVLAVEAEEFRKDDIYYESGIPNKRVSQSANPITVTTQIEFKKFRRQINSDKNLSVPERKNSRHQRCQPFMRRINCNRKLKNNTTTYPHVNNRNSNTSKDKKKNLQSRNGFSNRRWNNKSSINNNKNNLKSPRFKTKSLPQGFRRSRLRDNDFEALDSVSRNMYADSYRPNKRPNTANRDQNTEFFNVMQTFFDNQNAYSRKFPYSKRRGSKGTWLSGGYDIDSTLELVSTKSATNTYKDYDDEYQKSLSSVYRDYHNPLRRNLVNLLTELFVTLNNSTTNTDYEVISDLANENVEISESANDFCQKWIDHKDKLEAVFLGPSAHLPSCPCFYPSNIFYNDKIWDKKQQKNFRWRDASGKSQRMDIYKPGAFYCVRSLLTQGSGSAAAQHCCYDQERRLITRGSGAGTPNFVSPEASQVLHEKIDLLPWQLCKGDFSRFNSMRPPNNENDCQLNPDEEEYQRQKADRKSF